MGYVKKYALCLIDLQDEFRDSITSGLIKNVKKEVSKAVRMNRDIVVVLYRGCGSLIMNIR